MLTIHKEQLAKMSAWGIQSVIETLISVEKERAKSYDKECIIHHDIPVLEKTLSELKENRTKRILGLI